MVAAAEEVMYIINRMKRVRFLSKPLLYERDNES